MPKAFYIIVGVENRHESTVETVLDQALHQHSFSQLLPVEDAPTNSGQHTNYCYQICGGCKIAVIFDEASYLTTTDEHKQWLKDQLAQLGITLIEPTPD